MCPPNRRAFLDDVINQSKLTKLIDFFVHFSGGIGIGVGEDLLERRASLAPQSMQWAIRSRQKGGGRTGISGSAGVPAASGGGGFIYIDPSSLRRSASK